MKRRLGREGGGFCEQALGGKCVIIKLSCVKKYMI
jgi:hypothetical protein